MRQVDKSFLKEAQRGHIPRLTRLLSKGANVNCRGKYGDTPLLLAASQGHIEVVRYLLSIGADAKALTDDNAPTLFYACVRGHADVVEALLAAGADPNANRDSDCGHRKGDSAGVSMLHQAIYRGEELIVELLIQAGADREFVQLGYNALAAAKERGNNPGIIELVRRGRRYSTEPGSD